MSETRVAALVTGGASGLGRLFVLTLASMGYDILLHYNASEHDACELQQFITSEYGVSCVVWNRDFGIDVMGLLEESNVIMNNHGNVRVLVNNASVFSLSGEPFKPDFDDHLFINMLNINSLSAFFLTRAFIMHVNDVIDDIGRLLDGYVFNVLDVMVKNCCSRNYFSYLFTKRAMSLCSSMLGCIVSDNFYFYDLYPRDIPKKALLSRNYKDLIESCGSLEPIMVLRSALKSCAMGFVG